MNKYILSSLSFALIMGATSCEKSTEETETAPNPVVTPDKYEFERNGQNSVSYKGQTERLNQLGELKSKLGTGDGGSIVSESDLLAMYENTGGDGNGNFSFNSTKQLKNKTFDLDQTYFEDMLKSAAAASVDGNNGILAVQGTAGLITRGSKSATILVDKNGFEFTQLLEKGLTGGVFYYQTVNVYLTDDKIGDAVDNVTVDTAKNYTDMEHHWDEAFGYFGAPVDFSSDYQGTGTPRYWAKYLAIADLGITGYTNSFMNSFKTGRAAIVVNRQDVKNTNVNSINAYFGQLAAATAIHYANQSKATTDPGDLLHALSECYAFTRALRYSNPNEREFTPAEVETLLTNTFNNDLWSVTLTDLDNLINELSTAYDLDAYKDIL